MKDYEVKTMRSSAPGIQRWNGAHFQLVGNIVECFKRSTKTTHNGGQKKSNATMTTTIDASNTIDLLHSNSQQNRCSTHPPNSSIFIPIYRKTNLTNQLVDHSKMTFDVCHAMMRQVLHGSNNNSKNWLTSKYIYLGQVRLQSPIPSEMRFKCTQIMAENPCPFHSCHTYSASSIEMFHILWKLDGMSYRVTLHSKSGKKKSCREENVRKM